MSRRRWIVAGVLLALGIAAGGWLWWRRARPPIATLAGIRAVEADAAIGIWYTPDREWIGRLDAHGHLVWWRELAGRLEVTDVVSALAIGDGVVTLHYARGGTHAIAAFAHGDGTPLWETPLPDPSGPMLYLEPELPAQIAGGRVFAWIYTSPARLYALDLHDGHVVAQVDGGSPNGEAAAIVGDHVIERSELWKLGVADLTTRRRVEIDAGPGCVIGDDYITVAYAAAPHADPSLVLWPRGDPAASRTLAAPFAPVPGLATWSLAGCGRHGDHLVLSIARGDAESKQLAYVAIVDLHGAVEHVIALPELVEWDVVRSPLVGALPRFVVYPSRLGLIALDLESATVAWRADSSGTGPRPSAFAAGDRWFVALPGLDHGTLSAFDGATGKRIGSLTGYPASPGVVHGLTLQAQVGGDALWLWSSFAEVRLDATRIGTYDLHTLQPRAVREVDVELH